MGNILYLIAIGLSAYAGYSGLAWYFVVIAAILMTLGYMTYRAPQMEGARREGGGLFVRTLFYIIVGYSLFLTVVYAVAAFVHNYIDSEKDMEVDEVTISALQDNPAAFVKKLNERLPVRPNNYTTFTRVTNSSEHPKLLVFSVVLDKNWRKIIRPALLSEVPEFKNIDKLVTDDEMMSYVLQDGVTLQCDMDLAKAIINNLGYSLQYSYRLHDGEKIIYSTSISKEICANVDVIRQEMIDHAKSHDYYLK